MCELSFSYSSEAQTIAGQVLGSSPARSFLPGNIPELFAFNAQPYPLLLAFLGPWSPLQEGV